MILPQLLQQNNTVALLAASGPAHPATVEPSVRFFESLGLTVDVMDSCFAQHGYLAGDDALRVNDVNRAFNDDRIKALFFLRGGYGIQRILPMLDYDAVRRNPKIVAGYSDVTALHIVLNQLCKLVTFHAPMAATELSRPDLDAFTLNSFRDALFESDKAIRMPYSRMTFKNPDDIPVQTISPGKATGPLTGGNLSMVVSSLGTPYEIDTRNKILFLEDIQEAPYRVDRMLLQLLYAGKLRICAGLLLGGFEPETYLSLKLAIDEILLPLCKPILANIACGHTLPTLTLPMGATVVMDAKPT